MQCSCVQSHLVRIFICSVSLQHLIFVIVLAQMNFFVCFWCHASIRLCWARDAQLFPQLFSEEAKCCTSTCPNMPRHELKKITKNFIRTRCQAIQNCLLRQFLHPNHFWQPNAWHRAKKKKRPFLKRIASKRGVDEIYNFQRQFINGKYVKRIIKQPTLSRNLIRNITSSSYKWWWGTDTQKNTDAMFITQRETNIANHSILLSFGMLSNPSATVSSQSVRLHFQSINSKHIQFISI